VRVGGPFLGSSYSPRLQDRDLNALVILNGYRLVGIITERDIVRAVADRRDLADFSAGDYMTPGPATVTLNTPLAEVARTMLAYGVRHLPVVVADEVLGMVFGQGPVGGGERHDRLTLPAVWVCPGCGGRLGAGGGRRGGLVAGGDAVGQVGGVVVHEPQ